MAEQVAVAPGDPPPDGHDTPLSAARSGLKREHAFALGVQADLSPMGRTRSGKTRRISTPVGPSGVGRRGKNSKVSGNEKSSDFGGGGSGEEAAEADATAEVGVGKAPPLDGTYPNSVRRCSSSLAGSAETAGSSSQPTGMPISGERKEVQVKFSAVEEACFNKVIVPDGRNEMVDTVAPIDCRDEIGRVEMELDNSLAMGGQNGVVSGCQSELVETAVPIDCQYDSMVVESFDNGCGEADAEGAVSTVSNTAASGSLNGVELQDGDGMEVETVVAGDCPDQLKVEGVIAVDGEEEVKVESAEDTGSWRELKVETNVAVDGTNGLKVDGGVSVDRRTKFRVKNGVNISNQSEQAEARMLSRRFTRSLLKSLSPATAVKEHTMLETAVDDHNEVNAESTTPSKRFTRSCLKSVEEKKEMEPASSVTTSEVSDGCEQVQDPLRNVSNCASGPLRATPKKKMELKMSKKIGVTKVPANCRELIATGLLDGLAVTYAASAKKKGVLCGVIKDRGICCSCSSCKGRKTISAYLFEVHAGSTKKHPANFICLENGSSLHDVIKACANAPLDMMESTIKNAAGLDAKNQGLICQQCKIPFLSSRMGKLSLVCDACFMQQPTSNNQRVPSVAAKKKSSSKDLSSEKKSAKGRITTKLASFSSDSSSKNMSSEMKSAQRKMTTKDFWLHKLVFMNDTLPDGTEVAYYTRGQRLLEGYIKGSGIFCRCCNSVVSPSLFEAHAGCAQRKKPYLNIYTSNGVSLHELSVSLSKDKTFSARENDDLCRICAGDGDLLLCDSCPRSFHKECVGLSTIPEGNWYCQYCESMIQRESYVAHNENAIAAGRIKGVDPIEQIFKRCIRIIQNPEMDASSCVLCRAHDFSKTGFGPRTVLLCDQCEKEFHIGCLKSHNIADLKELPEGEWFCCSDCSILYIELRKFVSSGVQQLPEPLLDVIKNKVKEKCLTTDPDLDLRWQLLNGKMADSDSRLLLPSAVSILQESFDPIVDLPTGQDLIPSMVYGRDIGHQDFGGMYCAILTVNNSVVTVGLLRVLGLDVAELPLVATTKESQGHGYFQALFSCIETLLESLDVKHLVLPATKEAEEIWVKKFGFCEITQSQLVEYTKGSRPMSFQGTPMLHKPVPQSKALHTSRRKE